MWYDCKWENYPQETKMTKTLTTIDHRTDLNTSENIIEGIHSQKVT